MPWVTIKTGIIGADAHEAVLREYLCDWSRGCANVAEHVVGAAPDVGLVCAVCPDHAPLLTGRASDSRAD
jgi:hypothetical protein